MKQNKPVVHAAALVLAAGLTACAGADAPARPASTAQPNNDDYYQIEHEGRVYVFDDAAVFGAFRAHGETPYIKVRIGAGPRGETVVFGLRDADKKKADGIAGVDMFDGRLAGAEPFYAEVWSEGRIYVFDRWADLQGFRQTGEAALRYTEIGAGPGGETVVYVLNDANKKQRPDALMARFRSLHRA